MAKNLKKVSTYVKDGQVYKGGVNELLSNTGSPLESNLGATASADRLSETSGSSQEAPKVQKICLGCSSLAKPDSDFCSSCDIMRVQIPTKIKK
jgi:hypothetical protein